MSTLSAHLVFFPAAFLHPSLSLHELRIDVIFAVIMFANTFVSVILLLASVNSAVAAPIFGRQVDFASGQCLKSVVEKRQLNALIDRHGLMKKSTPKVDFTAQAPVNKRQDACKCRLR